MVLRVRRGLLRIAGVLVCIIGFCSSLQAADPTPSQPPQGHVLLLYSNVFGLPAHRKNSDAFFHVMESAGISPTSIHYEYLDLIRNRTPAYRRNLPEWLREKYSGAAIAVIVTVDGAAQDFMLGEGKDLFPQAPIISVLSPKRLLDPVPGRRILQIPAEADFSGTLKVALELFPATRHVFFVVGDSDDELQWLALAQQAFAPWAGKLEFEFSNMLTHAELLSRAAAQPADGIVFYLSYYRDKDGRPFVPRAVAAEVMAAAVNPTFGIYDGLIGAGIVGGTLFSYEAEGERSGQLALDILTGKLVVSEPLTILPCLHKVMFDWGQLKRWGVSRGALPPSSIIVNRPPTIWEQYRWHVSLAAGALLFQSVLIAMLLIEGRRKRRAEAQQRQSKADLYQQLSRLGQLNQITRAIAARHESASMLHVVLKQLVVEFPLEAALLALLDRETDGFTIKVQEIPAWNGADSSILTEGARIPIDDSGFRKCLSGEMLLVRNTASEDSVLARELAGRGIGSLIAAPLVAGERNFGILLVLRRQPDGFAPGEVDFMRQLSEHLALAMYQAELYENLRVAYDELKRTQKVAMQQERLRVLGQMSSGIAHDVNNALSPIVMNSELILLREPNLSDQSRQYLRVIQLAASDIEHTVGRMREFYRSREDQEPLLTIDLNATVKTVIGLTQPRWRDMPQRIGVSVEIATQLAPQLPTILGVGSELREALTNLILNAVDALPSGGTITIGTELLDPGGAPGGGAAEAPRVVLWVRDAGLGMDEETKMHCLEPFYTKKGKRGTGLGLAMVYGIAQRHHAKIDIESALGCGTTFRLVFPVSSGSAEEIVAVPVPTRYTGPRLRILCVDDESLIRDGLRDILVGDGHTVVCAAGGQPGLEAFRAARDRGDPFQLVVTDLGMPYVDGKEVARTIHVEAPGTPVILLTGWGEQMKSNGVLPAGVTLIMSKPPKILELWMAIAKVAAGHQNHSEADDVARDTVLIMDDDTSIHLLAARAFRELGYTVHSATNGAHTLDLYRQRLEEGKPYAAVFLDLNIPGGAGGIEVAKMLRQVDPSVTVFVASGADDDPAVLNYERYGFTGAVTKPYRLKDLAEAVQKFRKT